MVSIEDSDEWDWLPDAKVNAAWYEALEAIDVRGDKEPLVRLLQSGQVPPPSICFYIGDLLDRYALKPRKARPRLPGYLRTPEQIKLVTAVIEVHEQVHRYRVKLAVALKQVAEEKGLSEETLNAAYQGQHGGLKRVRRHWFRP